MSVEQATSSLLESNGSAIAAAETGIYLYPIHAGNEPDLRSLNSRYPTPVSFINLRATTIQLWWLNFEGKRVSYGTVQPNSRLEMNTYETHPWVITDTGSNVFGIWLPVDGKGIILVS